MAAKKWDLQIVAPQWVEDSIKRGMILDEACYDPHLPLEDIGKGAWVKRDIRRKSLGKRLREAAEVQNEGGRRKLRKTASMKLNSQRENMWGQILGQQPSANQSGVSLQTEEPTQPLPSDSMLRHPSEPASRVAEVLDSFVGTGNSDAVFASCCFYVFGFPAKHVELMHPHITSREGTVVESVEELRAAENMSHRFIIVSQASDPTSHPLVPEGVEVVTEFFIEKCIHRKSSTLPDPRAHVIGRPFPVFPIQGFEQLSISTTGFVDVELNQVEKVVRQVGARYAERFTLECSMLICTSLGAARKQKLDLSLMWGVPIVRADWLWECISQGKRLSTKDFLFPELKSRAANEARLSKPLNRSKSVSDLAKKLTPKGLTGRTAPSARTSLPGPDMSAFDATPLVATEPPRPTSRGGITPKESNATSDFETAPTHQTKQQPGSQQLPSRPGSQSGSRPLAEKSANDLNKASTKDIPPPPPSRKPLARIRSEVADSEAGDDDDGLDFAGGDDETPAENTREVEDPMEEEKRRRELEKAAKAAAERQALSSKLASLLEGTGGTVGNTSFESSVSNAGADDRAAARRKRKIIGRVISNASAVSSGSQEMSTTTRDKLARTHSAVIHEDDSPGEEEEQAAAAAAAAGPTATQLEYDDPDATRSKARLMSRMLGRSSLGTTTGAKSSPPVADEGKITVGDVRRGMDAAPSGRTAGGRSMRRR